MPANVRLALINASMRLEEINSLETEERFKRLEELERTKKVFHEKILNLKESMPEEQTTTQKVVGTLSSANFSTALAYGGISLLQGRLVSAIAGLGIGAIGTLSKTLSETHILDELKTKNVEKILEIPYIKKSSFRQKIDKAVNWVKNSFLNPIYNAMISLVKKVEKVFHEFKYTFLKYANYVLNASAACYNIAMAVTGPPISLDVISRGFDMFNITSTIGAGAISHDRQMLLNKQTKKITLYNDKKDSFAKSQDKEEKSLERSISHMENFYETIQQIIKN